MIQRRSWLAWTRAALTAGFLPAHAADEWPTGPVRIVVPFPPSGPTDTVARLIAQQLQDIWDSSSTSTTSAARERSSASPPRPSRRPAG